MTNRAAEEPMTSTKWR